MTTPHGRLAAPVLVVLLGFALVPSAATATTAASVRLDGVTVALQPGTSQVVTVNRTRSWHARVVLWRWTAGGWQVVQRTSNGRIGYGGLVVGSQRKQGTGTTPLGSYRLLSAFGTHARSGSWHLAYRRIGKGDYWVEDNRSAYYNRYRSRSQGGFRWWLRSGENTSERLTDHPAQYEYVVNTSFNLSQVRHRGAGIFLHVNGRRATAGCVSVPRAFMRSAVGRLDPARVPMIAIGR